jgi:glycosyltransferase involved in cell wall biosynthesis
MTSLETHPPTNVAYTRLGGFHAGGPGVRCHARLEKGLNRIVRPRAIPDMGFRALRVMDDYDLIHVHLHPVRLTGRGIPLVMSEGSSSAVYLGDYLGWTEAELERAYTRTRWIYRTLGLRDRLLAMEKASRVYVFSEWARALNIRWGADPRKLRVVPPGFPVPPERQDQDDPGELFRFLFVGSDFERKGGFDLVEAFEQLQGEHPGARLEIAGSDPAERNPDRSWHSWVDDARRERLLAQLERLQRSGLVRVHGPVSPEMLQGSLYPSVDAFVMPTLAEGFGFTNVEAMSQTLPVISTNLGPITESVADTALLVQPGDVDALAAAMARLVTDRALARDLGHAGRRRFLSAYTIEIATERLGEVYREAVEAGI